MSVSDDDDSWGCSCGFDILKYFLDQMRVPLLGFFQVSSLEFVTDQLCYKCEA